MTGMPLGPASNDNFALNWCLAALTPWTKKLMEVKMAIKPQSLVTIFVFCVARLRFNVFAAQASVDARQALRSEGLRHSGGSESIRGGNGRRLR
jgi:hypothetical protein